MTNFDYIKTLDADQAGLLLCKIMDDLPDGCDDCPMDANCAYEHNGWVEYLKEEHKQ